MNTTVQSLNRLLALHGGSLPMYLASAPPHLSENDQKVWEVVQNIIDDQRLMIDKIADHVETEDGTPNMGEFPAEFTGFHDLSLDFILQNLLERQQREIEIIEAIAESLEDGSPAKALTQEALGAAKAHAQSLEESLSVTP